MEPTGPTSGLPALLTRPAGQGGPPPLQVGQLLQATVLENRAGTLLLALGHRQLSAASSQPFKPGEVLTLEVRSLGEQPVMRVIAALQVSATAAAVRQLLPRYGATTPLLASLSRLAQAPADSLPPALAGAVRALLRQLPERAALSTAQGVKTAIERSGSFLEQQLVRADHSTPRPPALDSDFKANLLRLLGELRKLPADDSKPLDTGTGKRPPAAVAGPVAPATRTAPTATAATGDSRAPVTDSHAATANSGSAVSNTAAANATGSNPAPAQNLKNAPGAAGVALPQRSATPGTAPPAGGSLPAAGQPPAGAAGHASPQPPFAGVVPAPQQPVKATLDALNSLGNLRPDLLQQTEAALARIHLNQLASLPREGEHRLVEWLFDIPVRRGEDIDFWSARLYRDADGKDDARGQAQPLWSVQLAFDLPGLGPLQAQISLRGDRVSTHFHAARAETLPLLHAHLHELRRAMHDAGLDVDVIDCQPGSIPVDASPTRTPLINEKA